MPKIQFSCVDCGKVSPLQYPCRFKHPGETYRCPTCARSKHCKEMTKDPEWQEKRKKYWQEQSPSRTQYACIDCGELSTWRYPSAFNQSKETYRCKRCAIKKVISDKQKDPAYLEKQRILLEQLVKKRSERKSLINKVQYNCIDCGKLSTRRIPSSFKQPQEKYRCERCAIKQLHKKPVTHQIHTITSKKRYQDPNWKETIPNESEISVVAHQDDIALGKSRKRKKKIITKQIQLMV